MTPSIDNHKAKILCVDNDPSVLEIYEKNIVSPGLDLKTALTAEEGLQISYSFIPDLIISDMDTPDMGGIEFCKKVKADSVLASPFFILASSKSINFQDAEKSLDHKADDYLLKPVNQEALKSQIKSCLKIKTLQDEQIQANKKLQRTMKKLKVYKRTLDKKNHVLSKEKQMIENSLKQISLMAEERERIHQELEHLNQTHTNNFNKLTTLLSGIIESKQQYHRGHSKKVSEISTYIAKELNIAEDDIRHIEIAALLHEIGKLSIPDNLAMKTPMEYSQKEQDLLLQHPVKGATLLKDIVGFEKAAGIIKHFHERVDGSGVPKGLKGNRILIGSRIIAVANIFDNLVFRRKNGSVKKAFSEIEEEIGTKFDSRVVNALHKYANANPVGEKDSEKELRVYELEENMILASGIFTIAGAKLLPRDTKITKENLNQIANYNKIEPIEEAIFVRQ